MHLEGRVATALNEIRREKRSGLKNRGQVDWIRIKKNAHICVENSLSFPRR
jgi:hypothetical protein